jgi:protein SCO1/2
MNGQLSRKFAWGVLATVLFAGGASSAQSAADEHAHDAMSSTAATDPHAAHKAHMSNSRYSASDQSYKIPDVNLVDANGADVPLHELFESDEPIALDFVFTTCTTICPVMTATFMQLQHHLGEYDRPEVLRAYAEQFRAGGNWTFLTGDSNDIESVLRSFDAYAGSKMNHKPIYLLKRPGEDTWTRIDGLATSTDLAHEVQNRLLN